MPQSLPQIQRQMPISPPEHTKRKRFVHMDWLPMVPPYNPGTDTCPHAPLGSSVVCPLENQWYWNRPEYDLNSHSTSCPAIRWSDRSDVEWTPMWRLLWNPEKQMKRMRLNLLSCSNYSVSWDGYFLRLLWHSVWRCNLECDTTRRYRGHVG